VVAESQYFKDALSSVIKCGAGYKPPSRFDIAGRLLSAEVSSVDSKLAEFKKQVAITGGTLTSDGWSNIQNRPVINCLLVTGDGAMFIDAVDTSGEVKDAAFIADELARNINSLVWTILCKSLRIAPVIVSALERYYKSVLEALCSLRVQRNASICYWKILVS